MRVLHASILGRTSSPSYVCLGLSLISVACLAVVGCDAKSSAEKLREAGFDPASRAISFTAIADQLNNLDQAVRVQTESRVPTDVILDATRSTDKQPILAVVTDGPNRTGVLEYVHVPQRNVDFITTGIQRSDIVDYHVQFPNPEDPAEMLRRTLKLNVAAVVDQQTLRIDPPLAPLDNGQSWPAFPIVISRIDPSRELRTERAFDEWQRTGKPAVGWEMTPDSDAIEQLVLQLNQWAERDDTPIAWQGDQFVATLPAEQKAAFANLDAAQFTVEDGRLLQEAVWLRDISRRAAGAGDTLAQASMLFEWTVRNLQLETSKSMLGIRQRPWQALVSGRATADERAWIFVLLLRQLNTDAVALAFPPFPGEPGQASSHSWEDVAAVAVRAENAWYLFDPALGVPIPGPDGKGIATLAQAQENPAVLRQLDVAKSEGDADPEAPYVYPYSSEHAKQAIALVEATPINLSQRARRIELQLAGANRIVLSTSPSRIADAIRPHVAEVKLWPIGAETRAAQESLSAAARTRLADEYRTFSRVNGLWKGRVLQFKGDDHRLEFDYADRPVRVYARQRDPRWYFTQWCRVSDYDLARASPLEFHVDSMRLAKQMATVWMGEISYEDGDYAEALAYFGKRTAGRKDSPPLAPLAKLSRARTHERIAELLDQSANEFGRRNDEVTEEADPVAVPSLLIANVLRDTAADQRSIAAKLYASDHSPQRHGSLIRARNLVANAENSEK
jgi:hypothetical protein